VLYEFRCPEHGVFEQVRPMSECSLPENCPTCETVSQRVISLPNIKIVQGAKRLPLGSGSAGRTISSKETGGMGVFIPSYGLLEQEEVDYIAEGAIEKEKNRVKNKKFRRRSQELVQSYVNLANSKPRGQKAKSIREAIKATQ
jgi:putative FmdB family regulatory protein